MDRRPPPVSPQAVEEHQRELSERWTRVQGGLVRSSDRMLLTVVGEPVAFTNGVRSARLAPEEADRSIEEAATVLRRHRVPAIWWVGPSSAPPDLGERLQRHGFRFHVSLPWMGLDIDELRPTVLPDGVEAHRVHSTELQALWLEAMEAGFGMDAAVSRAMRRLADAVGFAEDAPWQRFVALEADRPVGSAGLMLGAGVAGIYNVSTAAAARRRGIATAMTAVALERARDFGYRVAVLGAEEMARRLYERMGFRLVCMMDEYLLDGRR